MRLHSNAFGKHLRVRELGAWRLTVTRYSALSSTRQHDHPFACAHWVCDGRFVEIIDGALCAAERGTLVLKRGGAPHFNLLGSLDTLCLRIECRSEAMHWFPAHPYALGMTPHQDLALELERLTHLVRAEAPDTDMQCSLDGVLASLKGSDFAPQADSEPPELRALRLLESRNSPSLPIGSIASRVFVDRSHLARQFQMRFGCSMQTYRVRIRLRQVAQDLLEGIGSIAESALNAGFYDQSHCTRFFTSEYGLPPETWFRTVRSLGFQGAT